MIVSREDLKCYEIYTKKSRDYWEALDQEIRAYTAKEGMMKQYLADPKSGPCPFFKPGDTFLLKRTARQDDFYHLMNGRFCGETR